MRKIKLIIFDLDGVLVDARELHYEALNMALESIDKKYVIKRDEHLSTYDGLPTTKKLNMLTERKGLPKESHDAVWKAKQSATISLINAMKYDDRLRDILSELKKHGYIISVASNSIRDSLKMMLVRKGFIEYIDFYFSNQDVMNPKPNTEMYLQCMIKAGVNPNETLIIEDSHIGRKAAIDSGAFLHAVKNSDDVKYEDIMDTINKIENNESHKPKWKGGNMNVLIPMAGLGSRFANAGYTFPKPLIQVNGKPMIQVVIENLNIESKHIFIVQHEHHVEYNITQMLRIIQPDCEVIVIHGLTEGAACTTLHAEDFINNDEPLLIANSDQYIEWDSNTFMYAMEADGIDGGILTFKSTHPKWSFAKVGEDGFVTEVAEKNPISDNATVGVYWWKKGSDYVKYAKQMIEKNIRTKNEFYVCPVFNEAIQDGKKIKIFPVDKMWGLGTPEDLQEFLKK